MILEKRMAVKLANFEHIPGLTDSARKMLEGFMRLVPLYRGALNEVSTKLEVLDEEFQVLYEHNPIHHMESRMKSGESIFEKMRRKEYPISMESMRENIHDIAGLRVVCNYVEDIYHLADMLLAQDDITLLRRTDYIQNPKESGYRSLHLIVSVPVFLSRATEIVPVEVQLRTIAMDMWASLEHEMHYKSENHLSRRDVQRLRECADDLSRLDQTMMEIYHGK